MRQPNILLVEDQLFMQQVELALLAKIGYTAEVVDTGSKALALLSSKRFDIVFMDVCLPDMEGTEVCQTLRAKGVTTPIVAMTGNDDDQTRLECQQAGMNGFIAKPMNADQFKAAINAYVSGLE